MARISRTATINETLPSAIVWRAGLYLRLSKEDGDIEEGDKYESDSISNQKYICEDFLVENPDIQVAEIYSDDGYTGANFNRPDFQRLIEDIRLGKINCVIVKDLSRFGRNYIKAGQFLQDFFPLMNVRFISIFDFIDSFVDPNSVNSCLVSLKNVINEEYCRDISVKTKSVLSMKRENGEYIGGCPFGYKKAPDNKYKLIIDEPAAETVRLIFKLYLEGNVLFAIARKLNELGIPNPATHKKRKFRKKKNSGLWSIQTVRHILTHRMLTGDLVQGLQEKISHKIDKLRKVKEDKWTIVENTHEPIIDKDTFYSVQAMLKRDTRVSQKSKELGLFSGFLICADCGLPLQRKYKRRTNGEISYAYFTCTTYNKYKKDACTRHGIRENDLETAVLTTIRKYIDMAIEMDDLIAQINKSPLKLAATSRFVTAIETREKEQLKIESMLLDLYPDYKSELLSKEQYLSLKVKYESDLEKVKNALKQLRLTYEGEKNGTDSANSFLQNFKNFENIDGLSRELLITLVDKIIVYEGGSIEIKFKFQDAYERAADYIVTNQELLINTAEQLIRQFNAVNAIENKEAL